MGMRARMRVRMYVHAHVRSDRYESDTWEAAYRFGVVGLGGEQDAKRLDRLFEPSAGLAQRCQLAKCTAMLGTPLRAAHHIEQSGLGTCK